ncbi:MAG: hypothetical protein P1V97_27780 [Planctomycetota bacterium]|nr:hypothetical protein [Planctomycetota bacterium]
MKSIALVMGTLVLGLGAWFMLTNGLDPKVEKSTKDDPKRLTALKSENEALKQRIAVLEGQVSPQETTKRSTPKKAREVEDLREKVKAETARNKRLQEQITRLKTELPEDSPSVLIDRYLGLVAESIAKTKELSAEDLEAWQEKKRRDMLPLIMTLMAKPGVTGLSILNALQDPLQKNKEQLTSLLPMLFISQKLDKEQADSFNKRVMEISLDRSIDVKVRQDTLSELQLDDETESRREVANSLLDIVRDKKNPLREEAVLFLAKLPYDDTQGQTRTIILDINEPAELRSLAFVHSRSYEKPGGESMTLHLMKDSDKELRRVAYENAGSINKPSSQVLRELENALVDEKVESLFESISESLEILGTLETTESLSEISGDASRSLVVRTQAANCRKAILERLKK